MAISHPVRAAAAGFLEDVGAHEAHGAEQMEGLIDPAVMINPMIIPPLFLQVLKKTRHRHPCSSVRIPRESRKPEGRLHWLGAETRDGLMKIAVCARIAAKGSQNNHAFGQPSDASGCLRPRHR
jgi:hypothetical protein